MEIPAVSLTVHALNLPRPACSRGTQLRSNSPLVRLASTRMTWISQIVRMVVVEEEEYIRNDERARRFLERRHTDVIFANVLRSQILSQSPLPTSSHSC